jgi:hypothetical protein
LGDKFDLAYYNINWEKAANYKYIIAVSSDNTSWTSAVDKRTNTSSNQLQGGIIDSKSVRYVRVTITQNPTNLWSSFYEFEIYGAKSAASGLHDVKNVYELGIVVYPNPVTTNAIIKYVLSTASTVKLELYNVSGIKIKDLFSGFQEIGTQQFLFKNDFGPGLYYIRVSAGLYNGFQKFVIK